MQNISLTFKSAKQSTFESSIEALKASLADEFRRHMYILKDSIMTDQEKALYERLMGREGTIDQYKSSMKFLCQCLEDWHEKKVIVLIDEYDVPLECSYNCGFYTQMVDFIRRLFEATLKTNSSINGHAGVYREVKSRRRKWKK